MEQIYDKLVRDNIPNKIKLNGEMPVFRKLNNKEYWEYLLKKDAEELEEVKTAVTIEERKNEIADKLELIIAMAEYNGFSLDDIIETANIKKKNNGGFEKRLLLEKVVKLSNKIK
jgi:predicted house-cleaning noncanonical NTP pyrophosphatase (MazG superfamily)